MNKKGLDQFSRISQINMKEFITRQFYSLQERYSLQNKTLGLLIVILLCLNFLLLGIDGINMASNPEAWDTTAYLGEANFIKNQGGVSNFFSLCITGNYKQANQHPLYILLLTPFASTDISFFINAKIISTIIGVVFLLLFYSLAKKMFGDLIASISVFALILNLLFVEWTTLVACESLLILFSFLCMYFVIEGFNNNKYWIHAGVFAGLAYLTKGTSIFLLPGFGLSALVVYKFKILKNKYFWSFFFLFMLIASPLLIRNVIVYQNPFFNVNNYIITYGIESLKENRYVTFDPNEGATLWKFDKSEIDSSKTKSQTDSSNKFLDLVQKMGKGMLAEIGPFFYSFNIFEQYFSGYLYAIFGVILVLFFIVGLLRNKNRGGKIYFLSTLLLFMVLLSFNPIDRYFLPLVPFIWIYIAFGILTILDFINKWIFLKDQKFNLMSYIPHVLILVLLMYLGFVIAKKTLANPLNSVEFSESRLDLLNWLRKNLQEDEMYTLGPNFNWQLKTGIWILAPDNVQTGSLSKFQSFLKKHNVTYVIMVPQRLEDMAGIRENFGADPNEGLTELKPITNWSLVYKDPQKPVDFLVYKLTF